jgi:predicted ATPase/class 3 adenylate cyclase
MDCEHGENTDGAEICVRCGTSLKKVCPNCQENLPVKANFCLACGHNLTKTIGVEQGAQRPLGSDVRETPAGQGERRQATILFSDLCGYTAMNEKLDPEEVEAIMRRIKEAAVRIVESHGGIVNQFVGDEVLALYGISTAHEDDPVRAVMSAFEFHDLVQELSLEVESRIGQPLRMHTGIHTGLIVTNFRDTRDGLYGITGETVITGVRLKTEARPGDILVSRETHKLISPYYETEILPAVTLKGKASPSIPYRVIGKSHIQSRFEASAHRGLGRYVGRRQELEQLQQSLERSIRKQGQFLTVVGEAGIGKSRLLHEFKTSLDCERIAILQGKCQSSGTNTPYLPFLDALRQELHLTEETNPAELLPRVRENITRIDASLAHYLPLYLHLLSIHTDPIIAHMQGAELRHAMQEALARFVLSTAERRPTVFILEDWHWHDDASDEALAHLIGLVASHALLLVVTYRSEYSPFWGTIACHTELALSPLDALDTGGIMRSVLKAGSVPQGLRDVIYERTAGNPLFTEEICRALTEEGVVVVADGNASLTRPLTQVVLPDTVQAIIRSRLDRLDWKCKETLRLASVIGRVFALRVLEKLYQGPGDPRDSLEVLSGLGLVLQTRGHPDAEYMFNHVLTQQVTYDSLLLQRRKLLHGLVGVTLEQLYRHRLQELVNLLHHHFSLAEDWQKAILYGREAAERAKKLSQFEEALRMIEQLKAEIVCLPHDRTRQEMLIDTLLEEERLCDTLGWRERQQAVIDQMFSTLHIHRDQARLAAAYLRRGDLCTQLGMFAEADRALKESLTIRRASADRAGESHALRSLSFLRWHEGKHQEAVRCNEAALAIDRERGDLKAMSHDLTNLAPVLQHLGDFNGALERLQEALQLEETQQDAFNKMTILFNIANVYNKSGDLDRAFAYYRDSLAVCLQHHLRINQTLVLCCMASIYWKQERHEDCLRLYREVVDLSRSMKYGRGLGNGLRALGDFLLQLHRPEDALPNFLESTAVFAGLGDAHNEAVSWSIVATMYQQTYRKYGDALAAWKKSRLLRRHAGDHRGELQAVQEMGLLARDHCGEPSQAVQYFQDALDLAVRLGDSQKQGELLNTIGATEWNLGAFENALAHYEQALALYAEVGDTAHAGLMLNSIGITLRSLGRYDEALARLQEAIVTTQRAHHAQFEGYALAATGDVYQERGEYQQALFHYRESLTIRREIGDRKGEAWMLHHLALAHSGEGTHSQARECAAQALAIAEECGDAELVDACIRVRDQLSGSTGGDRCHAT